MMHENITLTRQNNSMIPPQEQTSIQPSSSAPYVIGLTGGIGSGKTLASDRFAELGVSIIDTDVIARDIVEPGQPVLKQLSDAFGEDIIENNGELNRAILRKKAFKNDQSKAKLDAITHPAIRLKTVQEIALANTTYCLVVVPLLSSNSPFIEHMQRILVVTADRDIKIRRVKKRSNLPSSEVERIMQTQLDDQERLKFADDVIKNNGSIDETYAQVEKLHSLYLKLASDFNENTTKV